MATDYTVVAPDLRGLGDSERPVDGFDKDTVSTDVRELVHHLGFESVALVGHDWGMPTAYAYAAQYRDEVHALAVLDAMLPGVREDEKPRRMWHMYFHQQRDLPELLVSGNERAYLSWFYNDLSGDPSKIDSEARDEYVRCYSSAGGLRCGFEYYRAYDTDAEQNERHAETPLEMPVLALSGEWSFGSLTVRDMEAVATNVESEVLEETGHWIPEERPAYLIERLRGFFDSALDTPTDDAAG